MASRTGWQDCSRDKSDVPVPVKNLEIQYCDNIIHALKYYDAGKKGKVLINSSTKKFRV